MLTVDTKNEVETCDVIILTLTVVNCVFANLIVIFCFS